MPRRAALAAALLAIAMTNTAATRSAHAQQQQGRSEVAPRRANTAEADAAYAAGDVEKAERAYETVLRGDPANSRALFMLAQLRRDRAHEAVELLERYVHLEPSDPWGHTALADALGRAGHTGGALAEYDVAERLAPDERDVHVGRARLLSRAGRTDDAIAAYEDWVSEHESDAEAARELARQYQRAGRDRSALAALEQAQRASPDARTERQLLLRRAIVAPRVEPQSGGNRDSDENTVWRAGGVVGFMAGDGVDLTAGGGTWRVRDPLTFAQLGDARFGVAWRPRATMRVEAGASLVFAPGDTASSSQIPLPAPGRGGGPSPSQPHATRTEATGRIRYVWQDVAARARVDLRATRVMLDASPLLVFNDVVRSEIGGEGSVRLVGPIGVRGTARAANITSAVDDNSRTSLGGRLVAMLPSGGEITAGVQQTAYAHASTAGYFAPRWTRTAEISAYREFESEGGVTAAMDLGAGGQQMADWAAPVSTWAPELHGWAALGVPLAPGRELRVEIEAYDAKVGNEVATAGARWRYVSASLGLRWALR